MQHSHQPEEEAQPVSPLRAAISETVADLGHYGSTFLRSLSWVYIPLVRRLPYYLQDANNASGTQNSTIRIFAEHAYIFALF